MITEAIWETDAENNSRLYRVKTQIFFDWTN